MLDSFEMRYGGHVVLKPWRATFSPLYNRALSLVDQLPDYCTLSAVELTKTQGAILVMFLSI